MTTTTRLFAVDLGASGGKCFVGTFDADGFDMKEIHRFPHEGVNFYIADRTGKVDERAHWNDTLLYRNIVQGLEIYRREVAATLDGIGIDTWGADGHVVSADGDMLGKVYCYRDHRLDTMIEQVKARIPARRIYEVTGIHFQPFNVSNQLLWFILNRRSVLQPGCFYLPITSLFYYYLGGVKSVDSTWASVTQLMDAKRKAWSQEILKKLDIPASIMPPIVEPGSIVGELTAELAAAVGLNRARLVAVGGHDTASAFAAAPVDNADDALIISSGTWSLVGKLIPEPITTEAAMQANISNEGGIGNVRFLKNCMGTWLVQELRRCWRATDGREMSWDEIGLLTEAAQPFTAFVDPDDPGFYNPANMEKAIVEYCQRTKQSVPSNRGTFVRIAYESLALKYRMVDEQLTAACGKKSKVVHIVGGGSKNIMLNHFAASATGLPVLAGPEEATAVGNLMVQAMGLGLISSMRDALPTIRKAFPIREFKPQDTALWNGAYEKFRAVCGK
jgi:sugar (pentulose or hexulose) kinase